MNLTQLLIVIGMLLVGAVMIWYGTAWCRLVWSQRKPGETLHGRGLGIALAGLTVVLLAIDIAVQLTNDWSFALFARWWFLPPTPADNGFIAFAANPLMALFVVAILTYFLGLPSWTQLRSFVLLFASPKTRAGAIASVSIVAGWLLVSVSAALTTYSSTGSPLLGILAYWMATVVYLAIVIAVALAVEAWRPRNKGSGPR